MNRISEISRFLCFVVLMDVIQLRTMDGDDCDGGEEDDDDDA